ncbi:MAG: hypothetical protein H6702_14925 [Myxococcales bacterium]|nr:hypothetical protein [Myxococcales bacterium]
MSRELKVGLLALALALSAGCDDGGGSATPAGDAAIGGTGGAGGRAGPAGGRRWRAGGRRGRRGRAVLAAARGRGGTGGAPPVIPESYASLKNNLRFKAADRLKADWSRALGLEPRLLCNELNLFDCIDTIHTVALGGVDAYQAGIYRPFEATTVTAPMIVERVALNACKASVDRDLSQPQQAVFLGELRYDGQGRLVDLAGADVADYIARHYRRILLREPTDAEVGHLRQLYTDVAAQGGDAPAYDWAILMCFSVLTSTESLFY